MIRVFYRNGAGALKQSEDLASIPALIADKSITLWVDIHDPGETIHPEVEHVLRNVFCFHPLAVDDALIESHVPKVDDWGEYLYLVLHAVTFDQDAGEVGTEEVDVFVGPNYLVTHHVYDIAAIKRQWDLVLRDERHSRRGVDYMLYELCDGIAADYMPVLDSMDEVVDAIQESVIRRPDAQVLARVLKLKSAVVSFRRVLSPQREVLNKLARGDFAVIDQRDRVYFRDVYDHFVRLTDLNESLRDLVAGSLDTYLTVTSNRTNDIVKALTILSVLFMPLTFITGFFGMNFFGSSIELTWDTNKWLFFGFAMLIMVTLPLGIVLYIRRRGWW